MQNLLMTPIKPRRLGKYVLLGRLGHGGMGKIYLASLPGPAGIEKLLVIKRLHSHLTADQVLVDQFLDEARLSMILTHPNVVHTFDVGEASGRYFMVMEYLEGQNLGVLLRSARRADCYPSDALAATLFLGVLEGLHSAHTARDARGRPLHIIHRDVSPQNIFVTYDGIPKVVDFGIAKAAMRLNETDTGILKGKYAYMSPEQCDGLPLDPRSDVFAAGIVLWEALTARRLYKSESVLATVERIKAEAPVPPHSLNPLVDPRLSEVVLRALQKRPEDRFESAEAFRDALEEYLHHIPVRPKRSDVRDLMHNVFADVIQRQRSLVERALTTPLPSFADMPDTGGALMTTEDRGETDPRIRRARKESTTPSGLVRMPLTSGGGPAVMDGPPTELGDTELATTALSSTELPHEPPRPEGLATIPAASGVSTEELIDNDDDSLFTPSSEAMVAPAVGAARLEDFRRPAETPPPASRLPLAVIAGFVVVATGIGLWVWNEARSIPDDIEARLAAGEPPPPEPEPSGPDAGPVVLDEIRVVKRGSSPQTPSSRPPSSTSPRAGSGSPPATVQAQPRAKSKTGYLTLFTQPWTEVYLDGKKLGATPLVKIPVKAGELTLRLKNPDAGIDEPYRVVVSPNETTKKKLVLK